ncbi:hypothetical protein PCE1_004571 [Barthelona sp. PCE]
MSERWVSYFDTSTGRPFYENTVTRERRWLKPDTSKFNTHVTDSPQMKRAAERFIRTEESAKEKNLRIHPIMAPPSSPWKFDPFMRSTITDSILIELHRDLSDFLIKMITYIHSLNESNLDRSYTLESRCYWYVSEYIRLIITHEHVLPTLSLKFAINLLQNSINSLTVLNSFSNPLRDVDGSGVINDDEYLEYVRVFYLTLGSFFRFFDLFIQMFIKDDAEDGADIWNIDSLLFVGENTFKQLDAIFTRMGLFKNLKQLFLVQLWDEKLDKAMFDNINTLTGQLFGSFLVRLLNINLLLMCKTSTDPEVFSKDLPVFVFSSGIIRRSKKHKKLQSIYDGLRLGCISNISLDDLDDPEDDPPMPPQLPVPQESEPKTDLVHATQEQVVAEVSVTPEPESDVLYLEDVVVPTADEDVFVDEDEDEDFSWNMDLSVLMNLDRVCFVLFDLETLCVVHRISRKYVDVTLLLEHTLDKTDKKVLLPSETYHLTEDLRQNAVLLLPLVFVKGSYIAFLPHYCKDLDRNPVEHCTRIVEARPSFITKKHRYPEIPAPLIELRFNERFCLSSYRFVDIFEANCIYTSNNGLDVYGLDNMQYVGKKSTSVLVKIMHHREFKTKTANEEYYRKLYNKFCKIYFTKNQDNYLNRKMRKTERFIKIKKSILQQKWEIDPREAARRSTVVKHN